VHAELQSLLNLQEKDLAVGSILDEIRAFEPEIAALDQELAAAEDALEAARKGIADAGDHRAALEEKIENFRVMQDRRRQRLEWVRGAKEASTLMAELDLGRSVLAKEEAEWIRSADRVTEAEQRAAEAEQAVQDTREAQAARREEIAARKAECEDRLAAARAEREKASKAVPVAMRSRYERIHQGRTPRVLYALHGDACGHCFTNVPHYRRQELVDGEGIVMCEACGVLMYFDEDASEEEPAES